jgi:hypothetical protein
MKRWLGVVLCTWFVTHHVAAEDKQASVGSAAASSQDPEDDSDGRDAWKGPKVQLSYRIYSLHDWQGGGIVNTAAFSGFLPTRYFRAGGGVEAGARGYEYGDAEGLLSGHLFAGYQHLGDLGRLVPYLVAMGEYGFTFGKRFHTPDSRAFRGIGAELGTSVRLVRGLHLGIGVSFMVYTMDELRYDTFGMRLSIGL